MRIKQEELPSAEEFLKLRGCIESRHIKLWDFVSSKELEDYLKLHKDRIRYAYDQYSFFLDGYSKGSASISEVTAAHDEFLKLLE